MSFLKNEIITEKNSDVSIAKGVVSTNQNTSDYLKQSVEKMNMAHGSHRQHSSSGEY